MVVMKNRQYSCLFNCWGVSRGLDKMMKARVKTWVRRKCLYHYDYPQKSPPQVARTSPKPTFTVDLFFTPSEGVAFSRLFPTPSEGVGDAHHRYGYPENYFDEFTSWCTLIFNRLKISGLQIPLHIRPVAKESECAARFVTI